MLGDGNQKVHWASPYPAYKRTIFLMRWKSFNKYPRKGTKILQPSFQPQQVQVFLSVK